MLHTLFKSYMLEQLHIKAVFMLEILIYYCRLDTTEMFFAKGHVF